MKKSLALFSFLFSSSIFANNFLPVDEAFQFQHIRDNNKIEITWNIAQGYDLYKDKIKFHPQGAVTIDYWPKGKIKHDETFGKQELYTGYIVLTGTVNTDKNITVTYQGCKLNELCYMPQRKKLN